MTAFADDAKTNAGQDVTVSVLANDELTAGTYVSAAANGSHGSVTHTSTDVTYTPNMGFVGEDSFTYTATDGTYTDTATVHIIVDPVTYFVVSASPTSITAGNTTTITVTAKDSSDATATWYNGPVYVASGDEQAVLPENVSLTNGTGTFTVTLKTNGVQVIRVSNPNDWAVQNDAFVTVTPAPPSQFAVNLPSSTIAGSSFSFTVTAQDAYGNTTPTYGGALHFTTSDWQGIVPLDSTLTSGVGTFSATLKTAGGRTITATDMATSSIAGMSNSITVIPGPATQFGVLLPEAVAAGATFMFVVGALDEYSNVVTDYAGTVIFSSSDSFAALPGNSTLDDGVGLFVAALNTLGEQSITVMDASNGSLIGSDTTDVVQPGGGGGGGDDGGPETPAFVGFVVDMPSQVMANQDFYITVRAVDQFGNTFTDFNGFITLDIVRLDGPQESAPTITTTNSNQTFTFPVVFELVNGTGTFIVNMHENSGEWSIGASGWWYGNWYENWSNSFWIVMAA